MNLNISYYKKRYKNRIPLRYKTNTRYQRFLVKKLEKYLNRKDIYSVCDIGCGQGLNTALFVDDFPNAEILGIDFSDSGIQAAQEMYGQLDRLQFICGDVTKYEAEGKSFDMVCAFELLEHIEDWKVVGETMANLATKYIMVSAPIGRMRAYEVHHGHYRNFRKMELECFFEEHGYSIVKTYYAGFPFWSPITRDLLNLIPGDSTQIQEHMSFPKKLISVLLYYLYRFFSSTHRGDQFVGLFVKNDYRGDSKQNGQGVNHYTCL